jgi:hypothetical protein
VCESSNLNSVGMIDPRTVAHFHQQIVFLLTSLNPNWNSLK